MMERTCALQLFSLKLIGASVRENAEKKKKKKENAEMHQINASRES